MVLELSPVDKLQIEGMRNLGLSLAGNELDRALKNYLLACRVEGKSPLTINSYNNRVGDFARFLDKIDVHSFNAVQALHVRLYLSRQQERKLNPCTINGYYRSISAFFNWLIAEGTLEKSPLQNIKPPRMPKTRPKPFTDQDISNMLLLCSGNKFLEVRNRAIILVFIDTGLRLSELSGIQLADINIDKETIRVMGKGAKERYVRIGKNTQRAVLKYLLMRMDNYPCLWVSEERRPIHRDGIQTAVERLCHRAGITGAKPGPHTFRHTAAIACLRNGMGEFNVQVMLGHEDLRMTRRYTSSLNSEDMMKAHIKASPVDHLGLR